MKQIRPFTLNQNYIKIPHVPLKRLTRELYFLLGNIYFPFRILKIVDREGGVGQKEK